MKLRWGYVSNSSSSSFVISLKDFSPEDQAKMLRLADRSDDLSRCTGIITDVEYWLSQFDEDWYEDFKDIRALMMEHDDLVIIRESDEGMGGYLEDCGLDWGAIQDKSLNTFEYH